MELRDEQLREALLVRCRADRLEPPGRIERIVGSARAAFEQRFCDRTVGRLDEHCTERLEDLASRQLLAELKADPGQVGLETLLREIDKLNAIRSLRLPADLFGDASEKLVEAWRARAARSYPSDLRAAPRPVRLTLLAALCWVRTAEITDALVDLLIGLVHKINARADRRVERELIDDLRRVRGKEAILFRLAEAAVEHPDDTVREALFPVVGEKTLRELVREAKANQQAFQARVRTVLRSSYSTYYRRMLPPLLAALEFRCNNTAYRPIMDALELLHRYADVDGKVRFFAQAERVPLDGVVPKAWREAVVDERGRVERIPYELCTLIALRDAFRRREIYVARREPVAQPRRRPARRLRHCPRGALRRAAAAARPDRVRHRPAATDERRPEPVRSIACRRQRRRHDHDPPRRAVDHGPAAGRAARAGEPGQAQGRGDPPLGHSRPARRAQGRRLPCRVHQRVHLRRLPGDHRPRHPAPAAVVVPVRARHEHGHPRDRRHRRARRDGGRAAARAPALHQPRQPAPRDRQAG